MPVKIDPLIVEELAEVDLTLWDAKHFKRPVWDEKKQKHIMREDKAWVIVSLAGPGVQEAPGSGLTLRAAVDNALVHSGLSDRVGGLRGAMLRLEKAMWDASRQIAEDRFKAMDDLDDDIPF